MKRMVRIPVKAHLWNEAVKPCQTSENSSRDKFLPRQGEGASVTNSEARGVNIELRESQFAVVVSGDCIGNLSRFFSGSLQYKPQKRIS